MRKNSYRRDILFILMIVAFCFSFWAQPATESKEIKFSGSDKTLLKAVLELHQSLGDNNFQGYLNILFNLETDREPFFREYAKLTGRDPYREYQQNGIDEFMKKTFSRQPFNTDNLRQGFSKTIKELDISVDSRLLLVEETAGQTGIGMPPAVLYREVSVYSLSHGQARKALQAFVRVGGRWKFFKAAVSEDCGIEAIDKMIAIGIYSLPPMELNELKLQTTMARMRGLGLALDSYITDNARVPECFENDWPCLLKTLTPFYAKKLDVNDAWDNPIYFFLGSKEEGIEDIYAIVSAGADGKMDLDPKVFLDNQEVNYERFDILSDSDYNHDLVYANGQFVMAPVVKKK